MARRALLGSFIPEGLLRTHAVSFVGTQDFEICNITFNTGCVVIDYGQDGVRRALIKAGVLKAQLIWGANL